MSLTIVQPAGYSSSSCGYCGTPGKRSEKRSSLSTGVFPLQLSCEMYQRMIDRGWRRSGTYMYKPDMKRTCCPQYTIRLDALNFAPTSKERKLIRKFNHFVLGEKSTKVNNEKKSSSPQEEFSLSGELHSAEHAMVSNATDKLAHEFTVTLEPSSFTKEKFQLYCAYQAHVHNDDDNSEHGFTRFLVDSPLIREDIEYGKPAPAHLPQQYGAHHQLYRVDGELIAMGVLDILPNCVSSVYFIYSPKWAWASLGKLSGLREIALAQEMNTHGATNMAFQYMGFYIHTCAKTRYKADFQPSYLLDPEEYTWHDYASCSPLLDAHNYMSFAHPEHFRDSATSTKNDPTPTASSETKEVEDSDDKAAEDDEDSASEGDVDEQYEEEGNLPMGLWMDLLLAESIRNGRVECVPAPMHPRWEEDSFRLLVTSAVEGFGEAIARDVIFYP